MNAFRAVLGGLALSQLLPFELPANHAYALCAPLPPLEIAVSDTNVIVTGTVTESFIDPPLDPTTPDTFTHYPHFTLIADEYIKGSGPDQIAIREAGLSYFFGAEGNVVTQSASIRFFTENSVGKRYVLFLPRVDLPDSPACTWSRQFGGPGTYDIPDEQLVQNIRAILAATPAAAVTARRYR